MPSAASDPLSKTRPDVRAAADGAAVLLAGSKHSLLSLSALPAAAGTHLISSTPRPRMTIVPLRQLGYRLMPQRAINARQASTHQANSVSRRKGGGKGGLRWAGGGLTWITRAVHPSGTA